MQTHKKTFFFYIYFFAWFSTKTFLFVILEKKKKKKNVSEKLVQEDLCKLLHKVPSSYHLYIFFQLDEKKQQKKPNLRLQHSALFLCPNLSYHFDVNKAENVLQSKAMKSLYHITRGLFNTLTRYILHAFYKYVRI